MRELDLAQFEVVDLDSRDCAVCHQDTGEDLVRCHVCRENARGTEKTPHTNSRGHKECFDRWHDIQRRSTPSPQGSPIPKKFPTSAEHSTYSEVKDFVSAKLRWLKNYAQNPDFENDTMQQPQDRTYQNRTLPWARYCRGRIDDTKNKFMAQLQGLPIYKDNTLLNLLKKKTSKAQFYVGESEEEEKTEVYDEFCRGSLSDDEIVCVEEKVPLPRRTSRSKSTSEPLDFCVQLPITAEQMQSLNCDQLEACIALLRMRIDGTSGELVSSLQERDWLQNQISVQHTVIYQLHEAQERMPHLRARSPNSRLIPAVNHSSLSANHGVFRADRQMNTKA